MTSKSDVKLGQFNFDDGGVYVGGCDGGKAHGHGVCTGPDGQGEFCGAWQHGFELSGVVAWSKDSRYCGQWMQGKRHGLGVEHRGHWVYAGEFTQGGMGRYGVRRSTKSDAKFEGTWTSGLQDGYGRETYADQGSYQGQWMKGCRHGYGVRKSAAYSRACFIQDHGKRRSSLTSTRSSYEPSVSTPQGETPDSREGHLNSDMMKATKIGHFLASCKFVLAFSRSSVRSKHSEGSIKERSRSALRLVAGSLRRKQRSNSSEHVTSAQLREEALWPEGGSDGEVVEVYAGEWKNDRRDGLGVCERSDGVKYEGEWVGNRRHGYGVTHLTGGLREEGRYKDDVLVEKNNKSRILSGLALATKKREKERVAAAVLGAHRCAQLANQKSDIANSRMESARLKASAALEVEERAVRDAEKAIEQAKEIKRIELELLMNKKNTKLRKKPSIPRSQIMMDRHSGRAPADRTSLQSDLNTIDENFQSGLESRDSFDGKPARPNSLQLLSKNAPAQIRTFPPNSGPLGKPPTSTISSIASTVPSQICEKIDNYFSYLNDEDGSDADGRSHRSRRSDGDSTRRGNREEPSLPLLMSFVTDPDDANIGGWTASEAAGSSGRNSISGRRLTLPSIIKSFDSQGRLHESSCNDSGISLDLPQRTGRARDPGEVLIVDGQRRFMEVQSCADVAAAAGSRTGAGPGEEEEEEAEEGAPADLPKTVKLKRLPPPRRQELGSMPDLSRVKKFVGETLPWKEVEFLSKQKRMEIERRRREEENLRKRSLVIRVGDFKVWLARNACSIFIAIFNILLVALFYVMLR